jgi:hypothetical protein
VGPDDDWKNQIYFPTDPLATDRLPDRDAVRWVKFSILTDEPARVYYQDASPFRSICGMSSWIRSSRPATR